MKLEVDIMNKNLFNLEISWNISLRSSFHLKPLEYYNQKKKGIEFGIFA